MFCPMHLSGCYCHVCMLHGLDYNVCQLKLAGILVLENVNELQHFKVFLYRKMLANYACLMNLTNWHSIGDLNRTFSNYVNPIHNPIFVAIRWSVLDAASMGHHADWPEYDCASTAWSSMESRTVLRLRQLTGFFCRYKSTTGKRITNGACAEWMLLCFQYSWNMRM